MSCHSQKPDPNQHFSVVTAEDPDVAYQGRWTTQYDSQHHPFQVSQTTGDTATLSFTGSSVSTSSNPSPGVETHLSSTTLPHPLPQSSTFNGSQTAMESPQTRKSDATGASSYTISSYTEVSVVGGSTTIVVIQTTVEVRQTQPYHGPSRGAVAGAAVGGLSFLFLLIGLGLWWWRRRRNRVRFLYGISNLDFDPTMMTSSSAELQTKSSGVRNSDATLYGDILPTYKEPASYSSLALDLKKHPPSEYATSGVAGDPRVTAYAEPNTRSPSARSLCDRLSVSGQESVESVVPLSKEVFGGL
ncbi:hypothetical protein V8D89_000989 [Ganoderma adspersum]